MRIVQGSLLEAREQYIAHQANCVSNRAAGLARQMFDRFPWSDIYSQRNFPYSPPDDLLPGNIVVRGDGGEQRMVIAMLAQFYPGSPKYSDSKKDGYAARRRYFVECLNRIAEIPGIREVAFPWRIGCGMAGGNWDAYLSMIQDELGGKMDVSIYRLEGE